MLLTPMGLYEPDRSVARDRHWLGPYEGVYDPHCTPYSAKMSYFAQDPLKPPRFSSPLPECASQQPQDLSQTPESFTPPLSCSSVPPTSGFNNQSSESSVSPGVSPPSSGSTTHGILDISTSCPPVLETSCSSAMDNSCPNTPSSMNGMEVSICAGCSGPIEDRFYLLAVEKRWHARCLRCAVCHCLLDSAGTCFSKDGNIFCKDDYQRLFPQRKICSRCGQVINSNDLVMRARDFVYHVGCFSCAHCNIQLTKGDHFGMNGPMIYCREHYQIPSTIEPGCPPPLGLQVGTPFLGSPLPPHSMVSVTNGPPSLVPHEGLPGFPPVEGIGKVPFFNGGPTPHKGRPRKRKPKEEPMDTNMNLQNGYDLDSAYGTMTGSCQPVRTKRIRTSFKHHQLRTMKHYFSVNHNPDAKDLKQLSQKTSLSKRVLQVWFQNARAKWRRQVTISKDSKSEDGSMGGPDGSGAEGSGTEYPNSPSSAGNPLSPDTSSESGSTQLNYQQIF